MEVGWPSVFKKGVESSKLKIECGSFPIKSVWVKLLGLRNDVVYEACSPPWDQKQ